ncbi:hypothetical protein [Rossellomorea sp. BNER]|uniref:hypothetical protein n=1 Tax=Rossellomorea sp. BNER TaxID=2962031 RepID=UPI003AF21808|nr:hypothetical protein [Rossellomorea sp. BNER]
MSNNQQPNLYEIIGQITVKNNLLAQSVHELSKENEDLKKKLENEINKNKSDSEPKVNN